MPDFNANLAALLAILERDHLVVTDIENDAAWPVNAHVIDTIAQAQSLTRELEEARKAMAPFAHFDREWRGWHARQVAAGCAHDGDTLYRFYVYDMAGDSEKQELAVLTMDDFAVLAQVVARLSRAQPGQDELLAREPIEGAAEHGNEE